MRPSKTKSKQRQLSQQKLQLKQKSLQKKEIIQNLPQNSVIKKQDEQKQSKLVKINIQFGDKIKIPPLASFKLSYQMNKQDLNMKQTIIQKMSNGQKDDIFIQIKFSVSQGRQKQAMQYLQKGMNETSYQIKKTLNLIQRILFRPDDQGQIHFQQRKGEVIVYYIIYYQKSIEKQGRDISFITEKYGPKLQLDFQLRGEQRKNEQKQTTIEPIYSQIKLQIDWNSKQIVNAFFAIFNQAQKFQQQQIDLAQRFFGNILKKITIKAKIGIFQKLLRMYREMSEKQYSVNQKSLNPKKFGLLKKNISITISWKKIGLFNVHINFEKEDYFHIILFAIKKILDEY